MINNIALMLHIPLSEAGKMTELEYNILVCTNNINVLNSDNRSN